MATQMFVNLPVKNLNKTIEFFTQLGFTFNPKFTDANATCMIVGSDSFVMLLVEDFFKTFITKPVADATKSTEAILALSFDSREKVDSIMRAALEGGATTYRDTMDMGWMYQRSFQDLDGHLWEIFFMDEAAMPKG